MLATVDQHPRGQAPSGRALAYAEHGRADRPCRVRLSRSPLRNACQEIARSSRVRVSFRAKGSTLPGDGRLWRLPQGSSASAPVPVRAALRLFALSEPLVLVGG